ncbi:myosin light chain kinase, smooth muscle-like [Amphiura filiformis]|uniref:myosin light chain kinase, smooth muscle-like n=1 Tax=Amphiura filiformis TaxID=82378 RepID=UPI003B20C982
MVRAPRIEPKEEPKVSSEQTMLSQMKSPVFLKVPQDQIVDEGMPLTLELQIQGEPTPTVTWAKDGMPITSDFFKLKRDGDKYSLFIDEALPEDAGLFTCTAANPAGREEKAVQVRVRGSRISPIPDRLVSSGQISLDKMKAPVFLQVPEDQTINEGSPFTLLVQIQAEPPPTVTWSKDGKKVMKDFYKLHQLGDKYSLSISDVLPEDTGFYTCTASNPAGRAERTIKLKVKVNGSDLYARVTRRSTPEVLQRQLHSMQQAEEPPRGNAPEFVGKLVDQSIPEGGKLQLECKVKGEPDPAVHWYKNGVCIDDHRDYHITRQRDGTCKLELAEVMPDDAGQFMCRAENDNGISESKARLKVTDPMLRPCFTTDLNTTTAREGHPCVLRCAVTGKPTPNVTWFKGDRVIKSDKTQEIMYIDSVATLRFKKVNVFNAGRYHCKAVNPAGEAITSAELLVEEPPPEPKKAPPKIMVSGATDDEGHKSTVAIPAGEEIRLEARIAGEPRPKSHGIIMRDESRKRRQSR